MKNIENRIKMVLTEELELPSSYKYMVRNAVYSEQNKNVFDEYCNTYNLNYKWEKTNNSYINSGSYYYIKSN